VIVRAAAIVALVCVSLSVARADKPAPEGPTPEQMEQAREFYVAGKAHHDAGEYDAAAEQYRKSYKLSKAPVLLYNIAQVERLGGHADLALEDYVKYLEVDPNGPGAQRAREFIEAIKAELEASKRAGAPSKIVEPDKDPDKARPIEPDANPNPFVLVQPPIDRPRTGNGKIKKISGLVVGGLGLVSIGLGVKLGLDARSNADDVANLNGVWDPADEAIWDDGEAAERNSIILLSVGSAAVVGGAVLYLLGSRDANKSKELQVTAAPIAGPSSVGVGFTGRF
jgi:tetratricopeptide (TPR) repeat protein